MPPRLIVVLDLRTPICADFSHLRRQRNQPGVKQFEWGSFRIPFSGSVSGFEGDVRLTVNGTELTGECKSRGASFNRLYTWLAPYDFLAIKRDRDEPLIIIEARKLVSILAQKPRTRSLTYLVCFWIL